MKKGVLLINVGSPDSPETADVKTYLSEFLNDPRVIDYPPLKRKLLVNLVIVPFRASKSAKLYKHIWTDKGSPLIYITDELSKLLQNNLGDNYVVAYGMRYRNPSIESALETLRKEKVEEIIILPLYPQYSSSATGTSIQKAWEIISQWQVIPRVKTISKFYDHPKFTDCWLEVAKNYNLESYDHILFSYHGLPERQIRKASADYGSDYCKLGTCCSHINKNNQFCYRANCFDTTRKIAKALNIPEDKYTVCFQSRLGRDPWIKPYSDYVIEEKAKQGVKKMLVFSPAFVTDCLETLHEIGTEYNDLFKEHGGENIQLVESLNTSPKWIELLTDLIQSK